LNTYMAANIRKRDLAQADDGKVTSVFQSAAKLVIELEPFYSAPFLPTAKYT